MPFTFHLIPHTHWDREWYLTQAGFQARLVPMMDDLLDRLEGAADPLRFVLDGQAVMVEDYLAVRPDGEPRIAALVRQGVLQVGPWYILADELIPAGESLLRNLLVGRSASRRFGAEMPVLYSPDGFGHPAVMPRIGAEFGLGHAVLWRGAGPTLGVEQDLFRWRHRSGAEVLVYHLPPAGYEIGSDLPGAGAELPERWGAVRDSLIARAASSQIAVFVGADHHGLHPHAAGLVRRLQALEPESGVRLSRLEEFFAAVDAEAPAVPVIDGELRWSYGHSWTLQGVHGTRARLKRRHGVAELELTRIAEPLAALAMAARGLDQRPQLIHTWKQLLQSQFHDTIAGTAVDEVAGEQEVRLAGVRAVSRDLARRSIEALAGHDPDRVRVGGSAGRPTFALFNPVPRVRDGVIVAELNLFRRDELVGPLGSRQPRHAPPFRAITIAGPSGIRIPVQVLGRRPAPFRADARYHYPDQDVVDRIYVAFLAPKVGGCLVTALTVVEERSTVPVRGMKATPRLLSNDQVAIDLGADGRISVTDSKTGNRYADLAALRCEIDRGDTYTVETDGRDVGAGPTEAWRIIARGPLVVAAQASGVIGVAGHGRIRWRKTVVLYAGSSLVRLRVDLWNAAAGYRLRLSLPTGTRGSSLAGGPFGSIEREPVVADAGDYPTERPVTTAPAHRFVAVSEDPRGLAVLAPGFFEYDHRPDGELSITLLRAVGELSRNDLTARPGHAAWPMPTPDAQEPGHHSITLAIAPVAGPVRAEPDRLERLWEDFALGCSTWWLGSAPALAPDPIGLTLEGDGLVASAVQPAAEGPGLILRAYNARAAGAAGAWRFTRPVAEAIRVRADETVLAAMPLGEGGKALLFQAGPHDLVSIRVRFGVGPGAVTGAATSLPAPWAQGTGGCGVS